MRRIAPFAVAIFASAFLIFLVQPMVGKRILPWFGGAPAVWTLCLAFYQSTLFLGYVYAYLLIRFVAARFQVWVHAVTLATAVLCLPVLPEASSPIRAEADPTIAVLQMLMSSVALPFLALASTGPLVQAWFFRANPGLSPYALYAVSNVGSLLALLAYPFFLERRFALSATGTFWSFAFGATGIAVLACALPRSSKIARVDDPGAMGERGDGEKVGAVAVGLWMLLSGTAVVLLMGITNKLCLDVASFPFLWVLPLAIYLITFILCFSSEVFYHRSLFVVMAVGAFAVTHWISIFDWVVFHIATYCLLLFASCMILHGELYRSRPAPDALTLFYLCVSAGGAIGGLLVGIIAPIVFEDYYELNVGLALTALLALAVVARDPRSVLGKDAPRWRRGAAVLVTFALLGLYGWKVARPDPFIIHQERSFFGVLSVSEARDGDGYYRTLTNGTTVHGNQSGGSSSLLRMPTAYYGRATGLGLALVSRPKDGESRIGVIGLGAGTLAAYGRRGDTIRFYEIDPAVVEIAGDRGYFTFLEDSRAKIEVVLGDARLSIAREQAEHDRQDFDFLVLDAFSSDAIPIHLLTEEAFELYFDALAENGLMAVHVSNRHIQLMGLVSKIARNLGAYSLLIKTDAMLQLESSGSEWVIIARDSDQLTRLAIRIKKRLRALQIPPTSIQMLRESDFHLESIQGWTDDYSDVLGLLRWKDSM